MSAHFPAAASLSSGGRPSHLSFAFAITLARQFLNYLAQFACRAYFLLLVPSAPPSSLFLPAPPQKPPSPLLQLMICLPAPSPSLSPTFVHILENSREVFMGKGGMGGWGSGEVCFFLAGPGAIKIQPARLQWRHCSGKPIIDYVCDWRQQQRRKDAPRPSRSPTPLPPLPRPTPRLPLSPPPPTRQRRVKPSPSPSTHNHPEMQSPTTTTPHKTLNPASSSYLTGGGGSGGWGRLGFGRGAVGGRKRGVGTAGFWELEGCMIFLDMSESAFPRYVSEADPSATAIMVLLQSEIDSLVPASLREKARTEGKASCGKQVFLLPEQAQDYSLEGNASVVCSQGVEGLFNYQGIASSLLASAYRFSRHSQPQKIYQISFPQQAKQRQQVLNLVQAKIQTREWANGRGDVEGSPEFFLGIAQRMAQQHNLKLTVLKGEELVREGLGMFHAVGRGSSRPPIMINLAYRGDPHSEDWTAFVGKGLCFDSGGMNLKSTAYLSPMFLDKHGACSCLSAFQMAVQEQLPINLTVTLGMCENLLGSNSYRTSDILLSRKGLTVQVADTDAEGRLVLADCMHWTQEKYKTAHLIELSTLTYSCMVALGPFMAGIFGNDQQFTRAVTQAGQTVDEDSWQLPLTRKHRKMLECPYADCLSDTDDSPGASVAAAFLQKFVEKGTKWIHLDIGGVTIIDNNGSGYGARLLLSLARSLSQQK